MAVFFWYYLCFCVIGSMYRLFINYLVRTIELKTIDYNKQLVSQSTEHVIFHEKMCDPLFSPIDSDYVVVVVKDSYLSVEKALKLFFFLVLIYICMSFLPAQVEHSDDPSLIYWLKGQEQLAKEGPFLFWLVVFSQSRDWLGRFHFLFQTTHMVIKKVYSGSCRAPSARKSY